MTKGFIADSSGKIKSSWVWNNSDTKCPYPHHSQLSEGDIAYSSDDTDYEVFYNDFLTRAAERMVTRDELSVVSVNSGRIVLDNLVKQT